MRDWEGKLTPLPEGEGAGGEGELDAAVDNEVEVEVVKLFLTPFGPRPRARRTVPVSCREGETALPSPAGRGKQGLPSPGGRGGGVRESSLRLPVPRLCLPGFDD